MEKSILYFGILVGKVCFLQNAFLQLVCISVHSPDYLTMLIIKKRGFVIRVSNATFNNI